MKSSYASFAYVILALVAIPAVAQFIEAPTPPPPPLGSLDLPPVMDRVSGLPLVDDGGGGFIKDETAAILLGKALFWDTQVGSDGIACGTCHYHAGADNRARNQLSPGIKGGNGVFDTTNTGGGGPNYELTADDFPLHKLSIPDVRDSAVINSIDDVVSSQGTFAANFDDIKEGQAADNCNNILPDPFGFHLDGLNVRRVEPRNTPTIVNAAFNHRNFWDGRANNIFNGVDNSGLRNAGAKIITNKGGSLSADNVAFENSSLASQAVTPVNSDFEMACSGRVFPKVGKKMLSLEALANQKVHPNDSVLGGVSGHPHNGLDGQGNNGILYPDLVQAAFADWLWDSNAIFDIDGNQIGVGSPSGTDQYSQMEMNFSLLWGLAIMSYERTLISDDAPFDQWSAQNEADGGQDMPIVDGKGILSADEVDGMNLFFTNTMGQRGLCSTCHQGPAFSTATFPFSIEEESGEFPEQEQLVERMKMGDGFTVAENLFRFSTSGSGTLGAYSIDGTAGSWNHPDSYPATSGGDISVNGCVRDVYSYLSNVDTILIPTGQPFPPFIEVPNTATRDSVFVLRGCGEWLQITIVENGPGIDTGTVQPILPIVKQPPRSDPLPIVPDGPAASGTIAGDFTLNGPTLYDTAFYNIGVRPTVEDLGVGDTDANGVPLSYTHQWRDSLLGTPIQDDFRLQLSRLHLPFNWYGDAVFYPGGLTGPEWPIIAFVPFLPFPDPACPAPAICQVGIEEGKGHGAYPKYPTGGGFFPDSLQAAAINAMPTAVAGSFKTSGLRNVELTGPFFHNGGQQTLDQVLEFYNRGSDFGLDNIGNLSPNIHPLGLDSTQRDQIVAFLKTLTDDRVRCEQAPFDHPEISIPIGAKVKKGMLEQDSKNPGQSKDQKELIPAVGAGGRPGSALPCLQGFLE